MEDRLIGSRQVFAEHHNDLTRMRDFATGLEKGELPDYLLSPVEEYRQYLAEIKRINQPRLRQRIDMITRVLETGDHSDPEFFKKIRPFSFKMPGNTLNILFRYGNALQRMVQSDNLLGKVSGDQSGLRPGEVIDDGPHATSGPTGVPPGHGFHDAVSLVQGRRATTVADELAQKYQQALDAAGSVRYGAIWYELDLSKKQDGKSTAEPPRAPRKGPAAKKKTTAARDTTTLDSPSESSESDEPRPPPAGGVASRRGKRGRQDETPETQKPPSKRAKDGEDDAAYEDPTQKQPRRIASARGRRGKSANARVPPPPKKAAPDAQPAEPKTPSPRKSAPADPNPPDLGDEGDDNEDEDDDNNDEPGAGAAAIDVNDNAYWDKNTLSALPVIYRQKAGDFWEYRLVSCPICEGNGAAGKNDYIRGLAGITKHIKDGHQVDAKQSFTQDELFELLTEDELRKFIRGTRGDKPRGGWPILPLLLGHAPKRNIHRVMSPTRQSQVAARKANKNTWVRAKLGGILRSPPKKRRSYTIKGKEGERLAEPASDHSESGDGGEETEVDGEVDDAA